MIMKYLLLQEAVVLYSTHISQRVINMAHLGARAFDDIGGEVVQTTSFVISPEIERRYISKFINLVGGGSSSEKEALFLSNNVLNTLCHDEKSQSHPYS